jgi:hypothetical protein
VPQANNSSLENANVGRRGALGLAPIDIKDVLSNRKGISLGDGAGPRQFACGCGVAALINTEASADATHASHT